MGDPADEAAKYEEVFTQASIERAKKANGKRLVFTGFCHNCQDPVDEPKRFCDADCLSDWEWREKARERNGALR